MLKIDYSNMSAQELRNYFLANRDDKIALQAYLKRRNNEDQKVITKVGDSDFVLILILSYLN